LKNKESKASTININNFVATCVVLLECKSCSYVLESLGDLDGRAVELVGDRFLSGGVQVGELLTQVSVDDSLKKFVLIKLNRLNYFVGILSFTLIG
jgi:hypothetical protein